MPPTKSKPTRLYAVHVPTPAELKRLAKAHVKAEDALRHAELRVMVSKKSKSTRR